MNRIFLTFLTGGCLLLTGCDKSAEPAASATPVAATPAPAPNITSVTPVAPPANAGPPTGLAPAAMPTAPDPLDNLKNAPDGSKKTDLEALQAIVDGYAFGVDGLGAPPIANLDVLVTKGFLKRIPAPPAGKKWAYDPSKWKVSLVDQ